MRMSTRVFLMAGLVVMTYLPAALAQDMTTATVNGTTIWVGGGVQFLSLPHIRFVGQGSSPTNYAPAEEQRERLVGLLGRDRRRPRDATRPVGRTRV